MFGKLSATSVLDKDHKNDILDKFIDAVLVRETIHIYIMLLD